jgi:RNA polymerase subunit RPABC4/transcription elongation factor Spt4
MIEDQEEPIICYNCDQEFVVTSAYGDEAVEFCPFCGSELAEEDEDAIIVDPGYEDDEDEEDDKPGRHDNEH